MAGWVGRRVVTGHDGDGRSVVLSDGPPPQHHPMTREAAGADFVEIWHEGAAVPPLAPLPAAEPNERPFTIMPPTGHLLRLIELLPLSQGGQRTPMHRTETLDYVVVIEGEIVLILDQEEVTLRPGDAVVQRGTDHAWENRSDAPARAAFFHIAAAFAPALLDLLPRPLQLMR